MPLPEDIPPPVMQVLGTITKAQQAMTKAHEWLDTARSDRDHGIAQLRAAGWTLEQVALYTELSVGAIRKISKQQGVVSYRAAHIRTEVDA